MKLLLISNHAGSWAGTLFYQAAGDVLAATDFAGVNQHVLGLLDRALGHQPGSLEFLFLNSAPDVLAFTHESPLFHAVSVGNTFFMDFSFPREITSISTVMKRCLNQNERNKI